MVIYDNHWWYMSLMAGCLEKMCGCGCLLVCKRSFFLEFYSTLCHDKVEKKYKLDFDIKFVDHW